MEIKINPEYEKLLPKLTGEEFEALMASIKSDGQLYPIIVNKDGVILDGHNRFHAMLNLDMSPNFEVRNFASLLEEKRFVIEVNLKRRHLNAFQRAEMGIALMDVEKELAKHRESQGGKGIKVSDASATFGKVDDIIGAKIGIHGDTFRMAKQVIGVANEETKDKLRSGEWGIRYAYEGYKALEGVEDKNKKKTLRVAFEKEEINPIQLNDITKKSVLAQELIESRAPKDKREEMTNKYEEKMYTPDLDIGKLEEDLNEVSGLAELKEVEISKDIKKTKTEAENFAKDCGGFLIGETCYWKMKVDPYKYRKVSEA